MVEKAALFTTRLINAWRCPDLLAIYCAILSIVVTGIMSSIKVLSLLG